MVVQGAEMLLEPKLQHVSCNLCGADDISPVIVQNDFRMVECRRCGLVYVDPRPDLDHLRRLYNFYHERGGKDERTWRRLMSSIFSESAAILSEMLPNKGNLLDIGWIRSFYRDNEKPGLDGVRD